MLRGRKRVRQRDDHPFFPGDRNDCIDKKHASRHNLPERKKTGGEDSYLQATAVALSIKPRISTLRRYRRLQYAAFDGPWTKSPFIIFLLFIIFHNFLGFFTRIFSGVGSHTALMRLVHFYFPSASIDNLFHDALVAPQWRPR
jgi:hypothetical protein